MSDLHYQLGRLEQENINLRREIEALKQERERAATNAIILLKQIVDVGNGLHDCIPCNLCGSYTPCPKCQNVLKEWDTTTEQI